ncbi:hypothetical protein CVIRNUC_004334 [Coccomyxa viridis]|uniref:J domain-containing protein n=1 Tax=Coccomyxa viridis TaxID=1274662 RepID=A0AAV1I5G0_9CHLO|nr:hypothetical protein CVIRNUC_004334 [Coccomyxa viridis]
MAVDHYAALSLDRSATADEIRNQYRRLAMIWHPDRPPRPGVDKDMQAQGFQDISAAYQVLSDPVARHSYDAGAGFSVGEMSPQEVFKQFFETVGESGLFVFRDDELDGFFGRMEVQVGVGIIRDIPGAHEWIGNIGAHTPCLAPVLQTLQTQMRQPATPVRRASKPPDIIVRLRVPLSDRLNNRPKKVVLPAADIGADTDRTLVCPLHHEKIRHRGSADQADVVVTVETKPHQQFHRRGEHDLVTSRGVNLYELCVGGSLKLGLLSGRELSVDFGPLTGGNSTVRVPGEGLPKGPGDATRGDLFVELFPEALESEKLGALRDLV